MKIYSFSIFFNEFDILEIKLNTERTWINSTYIIEANRTFKGNLKPLYLKNIDLASYGGDVHYVPQDVSKKFIKNSLFGKLRLAYKRLSPSFYQKILSSPAWYNESIQRSACGYLPRIEFDDNDILIFSDLDEILCPEYKDDLINETLKRGIITVKLYFTMFYFNLLSENWPGPPEYRDRLFIMSGKYFKKNHIRYDKLRKYGENGFLEDKIYCYPKIAGFHHSWLGDEDFVSNKIKAYSHDKEHVDKSSSFIKKCISEGLSLFPGHILRVDNDLPFLDYIQKYRESKYKKYFFREDQ